MSIQRAPRRARVPALLILLCDDTEALYDILRIVLGCQYLIYEVVTKILFQEKIGMHDGWSWKVHYSHADAKEQGCLSCSTADRNVLTKRRFPEWLRIASCCKNRMR